MDFRDCRRLGVEVLDSWSGIRTEGGGTRGIDWDWLGLMVSAREGLRVVGAG